MNTDAPTRRRCFGYTHDGDIIPDEAAEIRAVTVMILSGRTRTADAVRYLNNAGWATTAGGKWSAATLSRLLANPRLAGLTTKSRDSDQAAPAIITPDQHAQLLRLAATRRKSKYQRTTGVRPYRLLSGLLVCAVCDQRLTGHLNRFGQSYRCPDGHVQVQAAGVEQYVSEWAVTALTAGLDPVMPSPEDVPDFSRSRQRITAARRAGLVSEQDAQAARARLTYRQRAAAAQLERATVVDLPDPPAAPAWWEHATDATRRAVLCGLIRDIRITAQRSVSGHTRSGLDTSRVEITLRPDLARVS